jgi:hypothetical protein
MQEDGFDTPPWTALDMNSHLVWSFGRITFVWNSGNITESVEVGDWQEQAPPFVMCNLSRPAALRQQYGTKCGL